MKPCPFCGCETSISFHYGHLDRPWVRECIRCFAKGPQGHTEEEADKLWDERA